MILYVNQGYSWNEIMHDYFPSKSFSVFSVFYNVCVNVANEFKKIIVLIYLTIKWD